MLIVSLYLSCSSDFIIIFYLLSQRVSLGGGEHTSPKNDEISQIQKQIQTLEIELEVRYMHAGGYKVQLYS